MSKLQYYEKPEFLSLVEKCLDEVTETQKPVIVDVEEHGTELIGRIADGRAQVSFHHEEDLQACTTLYTKKKSNGCIKFKTYEIFCVPVRKNSAGRYNKKYQIHGLQVHYCDCCRKIDVISMYKDGKKHGPWTRVSCSPVPTLREFATYVNDECVFSLLAPDYKPKFKE